MLGCAALNKPKLPGSSTCSFLALGHLFLCHTAPNSTPTSGLVLIYTLKYPCLHFHVYKKAGRWWKGNLSDDLVTQSQSESISSPMFLKITAEHLTSK